MPEGVRTKMIEGAVWLLAQYGVEGTSFSEVLAATGAPRGSVYHHFPGGKAELLNAALDLANARVTTAMESTRGRSSVQVIEEFVRLWRELLDRSRLSAGCSVLAVTVAGVDDQLLDHAGAVFGGWTEHLSSLLVAGGMDSITAGQVAVMAVAATEGAVAMCRAQKTRQPFDLVSETLVRLTQGAASN